MKDVILVPQAIKRLIEREEVGHVTAMPPGRL